MQPERVTCAQIEVGDKVARARTHPFHEVVAIDEGPVARRLHLRRNDGLSGGNIRPRRDSLLWRIP